MSTAPMMVPPADVRSVKSGHWKILAVLLVLLCLTKFLPMLVGEPTIFVFMTAMWGPLLAGVGVILWWMLLSGAPWRQRCAGLVSILVLLVSFYLLSDKSMQGMFYSFLTFAFGMMAFTAAMFIFTLAQVRWRLAGALLAMAAVCTYFALLRNEGVTGQFDVRLVWRWTPTAEHSYLAAMQKRGSHEQPEIVQVPLGEVTWSGFRGANRDAVIHNLTLDADWAKHPPKQVWSRDVGPGWSSFAVAGSRLFTQEQRGDDEFVVCWNADTGAQLWENKSTDQRFEDSIAGAGPRATPTLSGGKLYTLGARGTLQCIDPLNGVTIWKRSLLDDADRTLPMWGFSASPLVIGDAVIVHAGAKKAAKGEPDKGETDKGEKSEGKPAENIAEKKSADGPAFTLTDGGKAKPGLLLAYDRTTGKPLWNLPSGGHTYSSPQVANIAGIDRVLMLTDQGLDAIDPADGKLLANYEWPSSINYRVVQPLVVGHSVLVGTPMDQGTRRLEITGGESATQPIQFKAGWSSTEFHPSFNDFVQHQGFLYGFDNNILTCVDLRDGTRQWRKRGYGNGQLLLLADSNQLLVLSEKGQIALLAAQSQEPAELGHASVLEGKTWNHPVLVGARLYVRNDQHAAAFDLPLAPQADALQAAK